MGGSQGTQKRVSNESLPLGVQLLNRYYQSGADKIHKKAAAAAGVSSASNAAGSTPSSTTNGGGPANHPLKQSSFTAAAKNKISKTSIELEYSKFYHHQRVVGGAGIIKSHLPTSS